MCKNCKCKSVDVNAAKIKKILGTIVLLRIG